MIVKASSSDGQNREPIEQKGINMRHQNKIYAYIRTSPGSLSYKEQLHLIDDFLDEAYEAIDKIFFDDNTIDLSTKGIDQMFTELNAEDKVYITSLDRLSPNKKLLINVIDRFYIGKFDLIILDTHINTEGRFGTHYRIFLKKFLIYDKNTTQEARLRGIENAKRAGKYLGRKPTAMQKTPQILSLMETGDYSVEEVAIKSGVSPSSVRRIIKKERT